MVEPLYPGVFVDDMAFRAKPIDGVTTSTTASFVPVHEPSWTDANSADPGVTQIELFAFLAESLLYRAGSGHGLHGHLGSGIAKGLAIGASDAGLASSLSMSPGHAVGADGRSLDARRSSLVPWRPLP